MASVYQINKGINRSIEFKGFRAQYITYLAIGLVSLLLLFAIGFIIGVSAYILLLVVGAGGFGLFSYVYRLSHKYGEHGLMKEAAYGRIPAAVVCHSRKPFLHTAKKEGSL